MEWNMKTKVLLSLDHNYFSSPLRYKYPRCNWHLGMVEGRKWITSVVGKNEGEIKNEKRMLKYTIGIFIKK